MAEDRRQQDGAEPPEDPLQARVEEQLAGVHAAAAAREVEQQRRRARRYLLVGLLITPVALWLVLNDGGVFAWLALAIGVVDLVVGARAWTAARR